MIRSSLCALVLISLAVGGCGGGGERTRPQAPKTLVWGTQISPGTLNPVVSTSSLGRDVERLLFLPLVDFGPPPELELQPVLAESWELSEDRLKLTYHLRRDVVWEDGVPTTAKDVAYTFRMMKHPDVPFPNKGAIRKVSECRVADEWTVEFTFSEPSWEPLYNTRFYVIPEHVLASTPPADLMSASFNRAPIGNGRWKVKGWQGDNLLELVTSDTCPLERPKFDRLVIRVVPEETTLLAELDTGGVDVFRRFPSKHYREWSKKPDFEFHRFTDRGYVYAAFNHSKSKYADVVTRRALTMAIDRQAILDAFRDGFGTVVASPLYPDHFAFNPELEPYPFDPQGAAALLDEAGWTGRDEDGIRTRNGERFEVEFMLISDNKISEEMGTMIQAEYAKLGIEVTLSFFEFNVFIKRLNDKNFDATILARTLDFIYDPEDLFHTRAIAGRYNEMSFSDARVDSLIDLAKSTPDRKERQKIWWAFQEALHDAAAITVLYVSETSYPVRKDKVSFSPMDLRGGFWRLHEWVPAERSS